MLDELKTNNRNWAAGKVAADPGFFKRLEGQQAPKYLWIGCSDSRVPANEIVGLKPGELFVHRNVANIVVHSDLNCLSVLQYAVEVLRVEHIIVCGHYGCSGVQAAMDDLRIGIATNWLRNIQDVCHKHCAVLDGIADPTRRAERLCELNAIEQAINVCQTTIVREAWERGQELTIHGWVYGIGDGLLRDLHVSIASPAEIAATHRAALAGL